MDRISRAALGLVVAIGPTLCNSVPAARAAPDPVVRPPGERIRELQRERVKAMEEQIDGLFKQMAERKDPPSYYLEAIRELGEAELDLADGRATEVAILERTLRRFREAEEKIGALWEAGLQTKTSLAQAKAARLKAEIQLEKRKSAR